MREIDESLKEKLDVEIDDWYFSVRAVNCLRSINVKYIGQLVTKTEGEVKRVKGLGQGTFRELRDYLWENDLYFGMNINYIPPGQMNLFDHSLFKRLR